MCIRDRVVGGGGILRLSGNLFCHLAFLNYFVFFQRTEVHHPGGEDTIWGMYFVSLLTKNHIGNLVSETINSTGSLPFDIFHRPTNV